MGLHRNIRGTKEEPTEFKGFVIRYYAKSDYYKIDDCFAAYVSIEVCQRVINTYLKNENERITAQNAQLKNDLAAA